MKMLFCVFLLCLTGCQAITDGWQVERAHRTCLDKSGVAAMGEGTALDRGWVRCNDGSYVKFNIGGD